MADKSKQNEIKVFISSRNSVCESCGEELGRRAWITLNREKGALCLVCGDLDHLVFLPSGDAALTRRARKFSKLSAVVLKWSRSVKRYHRQGLLVEEEALQEAEVSCLCDSEVRARRRERAAEKRKELDQAYIERFAQRVREHYPYAPEKRETVIAEHACRKYSGRVGRCAAAKDLEPEAIRLAIIAHIRHRETSYDDLLLRGMDRSEARHSIEDKVEDVLTAWQTGK